MAASPKATLRYFDARGRAQFMRYYLHARDIAFTDERVPLDADFAAWTAIRDDRRKTGPFRKLPVLEWGEQTVAETLVIADFLHRATGDEARLSETENLRHAMLRSSLSVDLMLPLGILIWADLGYAGVDLPALTARTLTRIRAQLESLERIIGEWQPLARAQPVMLVDCLLWEVLSVAQHVFGEQLQLPVHTALARFYAECPGRATFEAVLARDVCQVSGRPGEAQAIAKLHELLAATAQ